MSSTHSDSNSKKVYRQPEEPTIQDVIAVWKKSESKVEELFEKVHAYDVSYVATNLALEPVQAKMEEAKVELKKVKADLEKVKATGLVGFVRNPFSRQQSGTEDSQKSAQIEEYEQIIKQKSAQIKEYEQTIEKQTEPLPKMKEQILTLSNEVDNIVNNAYSLVSAWVKAVVPIAKNDLLNATIKPEGLIHVNDIAEVVGRIGFTRVTHYIRRCLTGVSYDEYGNDFPLKEPIGHHYLKEDNLQLEWRYRYGRYLDNELTIRESISKSIKTLEKAARFFSSPLPGKPNTQTA
jgi:hypothetical protein